ncbi:MAG TPA: M24 family metallopeptidase [Alphaproteobacteria bacterium]|nr:M24 family metallopeptidase [Alphaproteobacteria bacterium]
MALERQNFPDRYFPTSEYHARWKKLEREMKRRKYELALIWGKTAGSYERALETLWLTNFFSEHSGQEPDSPLWNARGYCCVIMAPGKEPELHTDQPDPRRDLVVCGAYHASDDPIASVAKALKKRKAKGRVAFVGYDCLPMKYGDQLRKLTPGIEYVFDDDLVRACRRIKSPRELDLFREAGQMVSSATYRLCDSLYAGKTAAEAVAEAGHELLRRGGFWHRIAVSWGSTSRYYERDPMYGFSQDAPPPGEIVHTALYGPIHQGYWLDPARTLVVGGKPTSAQRSLIEDSYAITQAVLDTVKHGVAVKHVVAAAEKVKRRVKTEPDRAETMWPYVGHGNGLMWEQPILAKGAYEAGARFEEGMVASGESFLTRKGVGSAAWEQNYIVTRTGIELVTTTPVFWF